MMRRRTTQGATLPSGAPRRRGTVVLRRAVLGAGALALAVALAAAAVWVLNTRGEDPVSPLADTPAGGGVAASPELVARGAYLARVGNCMGCHTARGGAAYAGGRGVPTPFGTVFAPNLTPDLATGLGRWSASEFWRALHNGRARDGRLLYPAFPYPNYTRVSRADSDAIYAFLRSLPAVAQVNRPHELAFPFNQQVALAVWRALYFRPARFVPDAARTAEWNRGAYLVEGLGHCNACHTTRNLLGATAGPLDLAGGLIPVQNWYAPALTSPQEAGVADWSLAQIAALLKTGVTQIHGVPVTVSGPMAEVVSGATQYLSDADLNAMAIYLKALPQIEPPAAAASKPRHVAGAGTTGAGAEAGASSAARSDEPTSATPSIGAIRPGAALYKQYCADCHGERGEGAPGAYPALAGNRAVTLPSPANLVHIVLDGGFAPDTAGNPRPYGMPPFATVLNDVELAQLLSHLRSSWGNDAPAVSALQVRRLRSKR